MTQQFVRKSTYDDARDLQNGSYSGKAGDVLSHILFDTLPFYNLQQNTRFFSAPQGSSVATASGTTVSKDATWTNMLDSGKLPAGQKFLIKAVRPELILPGLVSGTPVAADLSTAHTALVAQAWGRYLQSTVFSIVLPGREFDWKSPASIFGVPAPFVVDQTQTTDGAAPVFKGIAFDAPKLTLDTTITIGDVDSAPVTFSYESYTNLNDTNMSWALSTLASVNARLRINLLGTLVRLK